MTLVLVVDDMAVIREPIAAALRAAGHETACAADGKEALALVRARVPDLILLDLCMPVMDGMALLTALRSAPETSRTPIILLTSSTDKEKVILAAKMGVKEYLLKSRFSLAELLARVNKHLGAAPPAGPASASPGVAAPGVAAPGVAAPGVAPSPATVDVDGKRPSPPPQPIQKLLTRDDCVRRAQKALEGKTLSGVVAQVIAMAANPRTDTSQLAELIARDPMLSARVLNAANSAAYTSSRGLVSTIPDAIRNIGLTTVRNLAAALGIFEAMPETQSDGFNPIRCWQHSFAVAQLCERLQAMTDPTQAGVAYLVGLCHDLGDILFHTHFGVEYSHVLDLQAKTGRRREEIENEVLGMTQGELVLTILKQIGLPETIRGPIEVMHRSAGQAEPRGQLPRLLRIAELYANGALLASSAASPITPLTQALCKAATGTAHPAAPDMDAIRSEVFTLTSLLARLSSRDEQELMQPLYGRQDARILLVRDRAFSTFDPVANALQMLANVQVSEALPAPAELTEFDGLVAVSRAQGSGGLSGLQLHQLLKRSGRADVPLLWLNEDGGGADGDVRPLRMPVALQSVVDFVLATASRKSGAAAA